MNQPNEQNKIKPDPDPDLTFPRTTLPLPSQLLSSNAAFQPGTRSGGAGSFPNQTDTSQSLKQEPGNWAPSTLHQTPAHHDQYLQQYPDEAIGSFGEEDLIPDDTNQFRTDGTDDHETAADTENWLLDEALLRQPSGSSIIESDSILEYENGRTYNRAGYILPNDPAEQDRMDFQYAAFSKLLKGNLSFAPFVTSPRYVLDVCAGTGIWAIDFAEQNPSSHVIGVDLAAIQPIPPVPNVQFIKDDARKKWLYQCKFDYVHLRLVYLNFADPKALMREAFENMNPGGWIEYQDSYGQILCKNGEVGPAVSKWCDAAFQGATMLVGHDLQVAKHYKEWLTEVGFVDVREIKLEWPCNMWPQNRHLKEVGQWSLRNYLDGALGVTYKLLRSSGLSVREIDTLVASAKRELSDTRRHLYVDAWIVYARKPFEWELEGWFPDAR